MNEQENTLLYGPVRAGLVRFALPVILSMLATQLYTVADTMVIGLRLDAAALAAVSNASTVLMIFLFVSGGMELGGGLLLAAKRPTATREELCAMTYNLLLIDGAIGLLMMALGYGGIEQFLRWINTPAEILPEAARYAWFYLPGLPCLMLYDLAKQIVMDGEGVSKFVTVRVTGARTDGDAHLVARAIARSPLVKTSWFGRDPNWGRVLCAAGYSGAEVDGALAQILYAGIPAYDCGTVADEAVLARIAEAMKARAFDVEVRLGLGQGSDTVYTCDLTFDYVRINAEYTT